MSCFKLIRDLVNKPLNKSWQCLQYHKLQSYWWSLRHALLQILSLNPAQTNIIMTDLMSVFSSSGVAKSRPEGVVGNLPCFYTDQCDYMHCTNWTVGPRQANLVLIAYASCEGSGEPAHPRSLARTFAARSYKQWVKRNLQTESQIPDPSERLGMRS